MAARPRQRRGVVSLRLDRLLSQLHVELVSPMYIEKPERLSLWRKALSFGWSTDVEGQGRVLRFFAAEALVGGFPPIRITVNYSDVGRLRAGIEAHPVQFCVQMLAPVWALLAKSGRTPRGRQAKNSARRSLIGVLAAVADEFIRAGGPAVEAARTAATATGYVSRNGRLGRLQLVQFLVDLALQRRWGTSLGVSPADFGDFARTYLYRYRARLGNTARKVAANQLLIKAFFGFSPTADV